MKLDSTMMYYMGCFLITVAIVLLITVHLYIRKVIKKQEAILKELLFFEHPLSIMNDHLYNIDNDVYAIKQRMMNGGKQ